MAEILGGLTILQRAFPTGIDGTRVGQWRLERADMSFAQLAQMLAAALGEFNQRVVNKWGWLVYITEDDYLEYEDGGSVTPSPDITDVDRIDMLHGTTIGHMLDLRVYGEAVGGSKRAMRDLTEQKFRAAVSNIVKRLEWRLEQRVLTRVFTDTENPLGTSGYDVGWVTSSGNVVYTPPAYDGQTFAGHTHYIGKATSGNDLGDLLEDLVETVQEHGHDAPYHAIVSRADTNTYRDLSRFVESVDTNISVIDRGGETAGNRYFARVDQRPPMEIGRYQSTYGDVILRATARVPASYCAVVKSYGVNNMRNPIAIRVHPSTGFGAYIVPETTEDNQYPVKKLSIEMEYGVSCNMERTAGAAGYFVADGNWVDPTIS